MRREGWSPFKEHASQPGTFISDYTDRFGDHPARVTYGWSRFASSIYIATLYGRVPNPGSRSGVLTYNEQVQVGSEELAKKEALKLRRKFSSAFKTAFDRHMTREMGRVLRAE